MEAIAKDEATRYFLSKRRNDDHVDERVITAIQESTELHRIVLHDVESFHLLIWQEVDATRLLTPRGQSRTMGDIASRLGAWRFNDLASTLDLPRAQHHPERFERCLRIDNAFDYSRFGWISIAHPTDGERR